jgi:hypothetical protein
MTGFRPQQGNPERRVKTHDGPSALLNQGKRLLRHYLMIGTGISSTAVGLALIVSFIAATQGGSSHPALAANQAVEVAQLDGRTQSALLDPAREAVPSQREPLTAAYTEAPPAPPLDVASPPAGGLDAPQSEVAPANSLPSIGLVTGVNVTFYDCLVQGFCGAMYNGEPVYEGAAACSWDLPLGTRFVIEGDPTHRTYVCADRGYLSDTWVDIFFHNPADGWVWQQAVGRYSSILIISVPLS